MARTHLPTGSLPQAFRLTGHTPARRTSTPDLARAAAMTTGELVQLLSKLPSDIPVELEDCDGRRRYAVDLVTSSPPLTPISTPRRVAIR